MWGDRDFWAITGQKKWQWDDKIVGEPNPGDSWCICMWAFANMIEEVGCDNVHLRCEATDVNYILQNYYDGGYKLNYAHDCLMKRCSTEADLKI